MIVFSAAVPAHNETSLKKKTRTIWQIICCLVGIFVYKMCWILVILSRLPGYLSTGELFMFEFSENDLQYTSDYP